MKTNIEKTWLVDREEYVNDDRCWCDLREDEIVFGGSYLSDLSSLAGYSSLSAIMHDSGIAHYASNTKVSEICEMLENTIVELYLGDSYGLEDTNDQTKRENGQWSVYREFEEEDVDNYWEEVGSHLELLAKGMEYLK